MRTACLIFTVLALATMGCSSESAAGGGGSGGGEAGGSGTGGDTGASGGAGPGSGGGSTAATTGTSSGDGGGAATTTTTTATTNTTTTGGGVDEFAEARQLCVDTINQLRATEGLPPLARWTEAETCSDESATSDEQTNTPHGAFPACGEIAQNECLGHGPEGIVTCLNQMWDERLQENCAGCDECDQPGGNCPDCDFFGPPACGHYVNMRAPWHSQVSCGFSTVGGWAVQNFH